MSESVGSINNPVSSINTHEQSDVKRPTQTRIQLQPSSVVVDDVSKNKSGSVGACVDGVRYRKRKKTRRGKSKRRRLKPYSRISWQDEKDSNKRANNVRAKMFLCRQPVAPYNTTQFLMDDHNDLQDIDVQLKAVTTNTDGSKSNLPVLQRQSRARDSSFSVDSDDDFYSSPEDEGDFLSKEFSNTYEDLHAERLNSLPKAQLIEEYLELEEKVDVLEKRLERSNPEPKHENQNSCGKEENNEKEDGVNIEVSQKIQILKQDVDRLLVENEQLRRENERLRYLAGQSTASASSVDSESDSTASSRSSSSSSSSGSNRADDSSDGEHGSHEVASEKLRTSGVKSEK